MTTVHKRKILAEYVEKNADTRFVDMAYAMMLEYLHARQPMTKEVLCPQCSISKRN